MCLPKRVSCSTEVFVDSRVCESDDSDFHLFIIQSWKILLLYIVSELFVGEKIIEDQLLIFISMHM